MLIYGETPNRRKKWLLELIRTNRTLIQVLEKHRDTFTEIEHLLPNLRSEIKEWLDEMIELERWRRREQYEVDQPYRPPSLIAYEKQLEADGELEDYIAYKAALQVEIDQLEYERGKDGKV